jgi:hypothetical protein
MYKVMMSWGFDYRENHIPPVSRTCVTVRDDLRESWLNRASGVWHTHIITVSRGPCQKSCIHFIHVSQHFVDGIVLENQVTSVARSLKFMAWWEIPSFMYVAPFSYIASSSSSIYRRGCGYLPKCKLKEGRKEREREKRGPWRRLCC